MNIKRKLQRLWQRLFLRWYISERILDEKFNIILLTSVNPDALLPCDEWELKWSRRCLRRYYHFI
jgi:hypothetical protein